MLTPVKKTSLATSVYEQLRDHILSGALAPGEDLPAERALSSTLAVNRSAIREALKRLEQAGLIAIHHGGNTVVLDYQRAAGLDLLGALITQEPSRQQDLRALRAALLPEVARTAAFQADSHQINRLDMLSGLIHSQPREQCEDLENEFWTVLIDASKNLAFRLVFNTIEGLDRPGPTASPSEFRDLMNAIAAGDSRGAALTTRSMITP